MLTTVTATSWSVSTTETSILFSTGSARAAAEQAKLEGRAVTLNVHRWDSTAPGFNGSQGASVGHPEHDGKTFATREDARDYCLHHGLLRVWTAADQARALGRPA